MKIVSRAEAGQYSKKGDVSNYILLNAIKSHPFDKILKFVHKSCELLSFYAPRRTYF